MSDALSYRNLQYLRGVRNKRDEDSDDLSLSDEELDEKKHVTKNSKKRLLSGVDDGEKWNEQEKAETKRKHSNTPHSLSTTSSKKNFLSDKSESSCCVNQKRKTTSISNHNGEKAKNEKQTKDQNPDSINKLNEYHDSKKDKRSENRKKENKIGTSSSNAIFGSLSSAEKPSSLTSLQPYYSSNLDLCTFSKASNNQKSDNEKQKKETVKNKDSQKKHIIEIIDVESTSSTAISNNNDEKTFNSSSVRESTKPKPIQIDAFVAPSQHRKTSISIYSPNGKQAVPQCYQKILEISGRLYHPIPEEYSSIKDDTAITDLDTFLAMFPPQNDIVECHWIQVHNQNRIIGIDEDSTTKEQQKESPEAVLLEFAEYGDKRISSAIKESYRNRLCAAASETTGKWMLFIHQDHIETIWNIIAKKVFQGELDCSAKVSNGLDENSYDDKYLICVYVDNFRDKSAVRKTLRSLLRIEGVYISAGFKVSFFLKLKR